MNKIFVFLFTLGFIYFARIESFTLIFQRIVIPLTFLFAFTKNTNIIPKVGILWYYFMFILYATISFTHSINLENTLRFFQLMLGSFMIIFIYVTILIRNPNNIYPICYALIIASVLFVFSFEPTLGNPLEERNRGITSNPNLLGMFMLFGIFSIAILWNKINSQTKLILTGVFLLTLYGIIASASRKSLFSAGIFMALWLTIIFKSEKNLIKILFITFSVVTVTYFVYEMYFLDSYMAFRMDYVDESSESRYEIAKEGMKLFKSSPIFGVGLGTFQDHSQFEKYAHNDFFELIATLGIIGLVIYMLIYLWLINLIRKARRTIKNNNIRYILTVFLYIILTMIILGLGRPHFFDIFSMGLFGIMSGYTLGVLLNRNKINEN